MISDRTHKPGSFPALRRDMLIIILVFILLAIIVWRWFDYRITRLQYPAQPVIGLYTPVAQSSEFTI